MRWIARKFSFYKEEDESGLPPVRTITKRGGKFRSETPMLLGLADY